MSGTKQKSIRAEREKKKSVWKNWQLYIMCLPAVIYFLIFAYKPMYGIIIAFKNYSMRKGIMGSPWIGFGNFERLFPSYWFPIILKHTLTLSGLTLILGFPIPILLALILNEVQNSRFRKGFQTISYAPHFISTVVLCGMLTPASGSLDNGRSGARRRRRCGRLFRCPGRADGADGIQPTAQSGRCTKAAGLS